MSVMGGFQTGSFQDDNANGRAAVRCGKRKLLRPPWPATYRLVRAFPCILAVTLVACGSQSPQDNSAEARRSELELRALQPPSYGAAAEMTGVWSTAFEHSGFVACGSWAGCNLGANGCWFEATDEFWQQFQSVVPPDPIMPERPYGGLFLIRFRGQVAHNGPFGHLDQYPCQVRGIELLSAERQEI